MKVGAIIQARYDSTRLPGKVLMNLPFDKTNTVLGQIINRLKQVTNINEIIVATSNDDNDNVIESFANSNNVLCVRGDKNDVLKRFIKVIDNRELDVVIRITGDNPVVLKDVMQSVVNKHIESKVDYTRNLNLPYGTSFEVVNSNVLKEIYLQKDVSDFDKEHVTAYIKKHKDNFDILEVNHEVGFNDFRFTIDYPSDYAVMNIIFQYLETINYEYDLQKIISFINENQWIAEINKLNYQKREFKNIQEEAQVGIEILNKLELKNIASFINEKLILK